MPDNQVYIRPCINECSGKSCCNCCGQAPNMHKIKNDPTLSYRLIYDENCCYTTRRSKPQECMHLQGKTRAQWMNEKIKETTR